MNTEKFTSKSTTKTGPGRTTTWLNRYGQSLKYALHVITHPFDGFWDLIHEKKGSIAAANTFLALFLLIRVLKLIATNFQFIMAPIQHINVFEEMGSLLLPFLVLCVANWAMTTLFEGKGRFRDIYMGMCYALVPYIIIQLPMILVSNMLTFEEGSFYSVLLNFSVIWCVFLVFVGLMEIHDYGPGKTFIFLIVTVVGAGVILFLMLVFFSLLSDAFAFFVSFYREIVFRLN
ncbi:MAG: YIP1 family protein [Clostridia bacterium]|nr:YIP1 family protein [Clostridia bacterium]